MGQGRASEVPLKHWPLAWRPTVGNEARSGQRCFDTRTVPPGYRHWIVERVYAHLGQVRHRSEVVEYQLEHHREALGERLTALETLTT